MSAQQKLITRQKTRGEKLYRTLSRKGNQERLHQALTLAVAFHLRTEDDCVTRPRHVRLRIVLSWTLKILWPEMKPKKLHFTREKQIFQKTIPLRVFLADKWMFRGGPHAQAHGGVPQQDEVSSFDQRRELYEWNLEVPNGTLVYTCTSLPREMGSYQYQRTGSCWPQCTAANCQQGSFFLLFGC